MNIYQKPSNREIVAPITNSIKKYFLKTSLHGFNHIAAPRRHWFERLLWIFVTTAAVWGVVDISLGQWQRYNENPTVVTLEKDFRTWRFDLPAVTACNRNRIDPEKMAIYIKSRWNATPNDENYEYYKKFVQTVTNSDLYNLKGYEDFKDDTRLYVNLFELVTEVLPEHRIKIDSSESLPTRWAPVMTELGVCFAVNSIAILDISIEKFNFNDTISPISCRYSSQNCYFILHSNNIVDFYLHSPYDVPNMIMPSYTTYPSINIFSELTTMETRAGPGVRGLPPRRRHCLYTDEPKTNSRKVYSTNMCRQDCRSRLAMQLCGCIPFYYFYEEGLPCSTEGMLCLSMHAHRLATFDRIKCICSQQCLDSVFREVSRDEQIWDKGPFHDQGALRLTLRPPRTRYSRYIVFHLQDLIVSFGGAAGLFLGASFISFVEIIYFLLECILGYKSKGGTGTTIIKQSKPYENEIQAISYILDRI